MDGNVRASALRVSRRQHGALAVLCLGVLMNTLNQTSVNVALASMGIHLRTSEAALAWVINAHLIAYGGCLLIGGRLGDLFGHRRVLLVGVAVFTVASIGCGLATSPAALIGARALQGVGGAIVSAMGLSMIMRLFPQPSGRAKALGVYALVSACGGAAGMLLGGIMTSVLGWQWIFFSNVPMGATLCVAGLMLLPRDGAVSVGERLDIAGAVSATGASMLAVYGLLSSQSNSGTAHTLTALAGSMILLVLFIRTEARARRPLVPLRLLRARSLVVGTLSGALLSTVALAWSFTSALYLQRVMHWTPLQTGLAFLPANLATAVIAYLITPILIARFGLARPMAVGFLCSAFGLISLARMLVEAGTLLEVVPGMLLVGVGIGLAYGPVVLGAVSAVAAEDVGASSGIVNTSFAVGGALGLAALATVANVRTDGLLAMGAALPVALESGYRAAFNVGAALAFAACLISGVLFRARGQASALHQVQ